MIRCHRGTPAAGSAGRLESRRFDHEAACWVLLRTLEGAVGDGGGLDINQAAERQFTLRGADGVVGERHQSMVAGLTAR